MKQPCAVAGADRKIGREKDLSGGAREERAAGRTSRVASKSGGDSNRATWQRGAAGASVVDSRNGRDPT